MIIGVKKMQGNKLLKTNRSKQNKYRKNGREEKNLNQKKERYNAVGKPKITIRNQDSCRDGRSQWRQLLSFTQTSKLFVYGNTAYILKYSKHFCASTQNLNLDKIEGVILQCCGSGMFIPDPIFFSPRSEFFHPGSRILTFYPSRIPDPVVKKAPDPGSGSATLSETCETDLRREGPLEGVAGLGRPAAGVNIRTVVVHPLVQLLAESVVVQLDLSALTHTHKIQT
jgi:hypothetical protein